MPDLLTEAEALRQRTDGESLSSQEIDDGVRALRSQLHTPTGRPLTWRLGLPIAGAFAAGIVVVGLMLLPRGTWYVAARGADCLSADSDRLTVRPDCPGGAEISVGRDVITLESASVVVREDSAVRLQRGRARFSVEPRANEPRFEVRVSHGALVVLGTSFTVEQGHQEGQAEIERGRVVFRWADGADPQSLGPGDRVQWPRRPETIDEEPRAAPPSRPTPRPSRQPSTPEAPSVGDIMRRLSQLRSQRRYDDASSLLREAIGRTDLSGRQLERLSYELGKTLRLSGDDQAACVHFRGHERRFTGSPRADEIRRSIAETCAEPR